MALNIAVPLTTVGDLMEGFGLLSPISPLSVDCRSVSATGTHGKQQLVSPVGSESSGVSSLDSDEIKVRFGHTEFTLYYLSPIEGRMVDEFVTASN